MNTERTKRYRDKLDLISQRMESVSLWTKGYSNEDFVGDEKTKLACYRAFQEVVEALTDIAAMLCKDLKVAPRDDYSNISRLGGLGVLSESQVKTFKEVNGLRNRLVHMYNSLENRVAYEKILAFSREYGMILEGMKKWIRKLLKEGSGRS